MDYVLWATNNVQVCPILILNWNSSFGGAFGAPSNTWCLTRSLWLYNSGAEHDSIWANLLKALFDTLMLALVCLKG